GSRAHGAYRHCQRCNGRGARGPPHCCRDGPRLCRRGHSLDFINKSFECLDLIGWQHATDLLPSVVGQMVAARGADESTEWRQPVDLVALCTNASADLAAAFEGGRDRGPWLEHAELAQTLLGDDPSTIIA